MRNGQHPSMSEIRKSSQLAQLNRLSHVLRQFGLVDSFELSEIITGGAPPSEAAIERRLVRQLERLPAGISAHQLAGRIHTELCRQSPRSLDPTEADRLFGERLTSLAPEDLVKLKKTPKGAKAASTYQQRVARILGVAFAGELVDGRLEVKITSGRRRVDIVFRNAAEDGFFAEIQTVHQIHAPRIWIECKNYSRDLGNPEVDQIGGRLGPRRGRFGLLACRSTQDYQLLADRAADILRNDGKWIVVLTDDDLLQIAQASIDADRLAADRVLRQRFDELLHS